MQPGVTNAYKDSDGTLVILNINPKDATYFTCHATNKYGTDKATVNVQVKGKTIQNESRNRRAMTKQNIVEFTLQLVLKACGGRRMSPCTLP